MACIFILHFYFLKSQIKSFFIPVSNDATFMNANKMLKYIFDLKQFSLKKLPTVKIYCRRQLWELMRQTQMKIRTTSSN